MYFSLARYLIIQDAEKKEWYNGLGSVTSKIQDAEKNDHKTSREKRNHTRTHREVPRQVCEAQLQESAWSITHTILRNNRVYTQVRPEVTFREKRWKWRRKEKK